MEQNIKKTRIWELDVFRGICIIGMVIVHALWDLENVFLKGFNAPFLYDIAISYGGLLFIFLSGVCVTLGSKCVKRGLTVLGAGLLVTVAFEVLNMVAGGFAPVYFGILHLLGLCMLLYPLFKRLPVWAVAIAAVAFVALGFYFKEMGRVDFAPLLIFGIRTGVSGMSDYFPLFPNLGYFLLGAVIGRTVYRDKKSLLPGFPTDNFAVKALSFCGRQSLFIYILHQPVVFGVLWLIFR